MSNQTLSPRATMGPPLDHRKKLTDAEVVEIRRRYFGERVRQQALAEEYGVSQTQISLIVRYKSRWSGPGPGERASFGAPPAAVGRELGAGRER